MEFLCHASAADHTASLKNAHAQSRHAEIGGTRQAIVAGTDYDGVESGHSVGSAQADAITPPHAVVVCSQLTAVLRVEET
jgi:hypothetical protein